MNSIELADAARRLVGNRGWDAFIGNMANEINVTHASCPTATDFSELQYFRGRIEMAQDVLSWLERTLKRGEAAAAELHAEVQGAADR